MSCDIFHAHEWASEAQQYFVAVGFGRDIVVLYEDNGSGLQKHSSIDLPSNAICVDYAPFDPGLIVVGGSSGSIHTFNFYRNMVSSSRYQAKYLRPVNAVSLNSSGLAAMGLDRARGEESLLIWDLNSELLTPIVSMLPNEAVSSLKFIPQRPTQLLASSYKSIREIDTRTNGGDAKHIATKYCFGVKAHQTDENVFLSLSESGTLALWDRRRLYSTTTTASMTSEPLLVIPRVFSESRGKVPKSVQFSPNTVSEFGVLNDGEIVRRWHTSVSVSHKETPVSALTSAVHAGDVPVQEETSSLFVDRVIDVETEHDKVVAFDYVPSFKGTMDLVCIRQSGQVFRMPCTEPVRTLNFSPDNELIFSDLNSIRSLKPDDLPPRPPRLESRLESGDLLEHFTQHSHYDAKDDDDIDEDAASDAGSLELQPSTDTLHNDINFVMRQRATYGYGSNCEQNLQVLQEQSSAVHTELLAAWKWLRNSKQGDLDGDAHASGVDVAFAGVTALWEGFSGFQGQKRFDDSLTEREYDAAIGRIANRYSGKVFVSSSVAESSKSVYRQLCLRAAGWSFEIDELEEKLKDLESKGMHEKAAGWAVFHGRVERAVESLAASRKSQLRLMSTAVAGYLAYKDVKYNNPWREQCRKMASELSQPYLRAIFAYVSDGSWFDVLDEGSLPVVERLGIALRFLPDEELGRYLSLITDRAVKEGNLEGIILCGLTPPIVDLLQFYVDKTADIQTASLIILFGSPRFVLEDRIDNWIASYRLLLNQWKMFTVRAIFDVSRNKLSKSRCKGHQVNPIGKQVFLRCMNCREIFGSRSVRNTRDTIKSESRCLNCNYPLPKCAICLLSLGPFSREEQPTIDKWPTFCMTCNHGFHTAHARQWFELYQVCPVPDCQCKCGCQ